MTETIIQGICKYRLKGPRKGVKGNYRFLFTGKGVGGRSGGTQQFEQNLATKALLPVIKEP